MDFGASEFAMLSLAASAAGTASSVAGSIQQGRAAQDAANYRAQVARNNAEIAKYNANYARTVGDIEANKVGEAAARLQSKQKVAYAASGVDPTSGTPSLVKKDVNELAKEDAYTIRNNAARQAYGFESQLAGFEGEAMLEEAGGKNSSLASWLNASTNVLGGAASVADKWSGYKSKGVKGIWA